MESEKYFSPTKAEALFKECELIPVIKNGKAFIEPNMIHVKSYIDKFFIPITTGEYFEYENGKYVLKDDITLKKAYFKRLPKEIGEYLFNQNLHVKRVISDINLPRITTDFFNTFEGFKHPKKDYASYPDKIKKKIDQFNNYIFEVLVSKNKDSYEYILNWIANMAQGNKNTTALYFKGPEGIGKSSFCVFLKEYVLGNSISLKCGNTVPLISKNNKILMGKLFVYFEELPVFNEQEWNGVSSKLKDMITANTLVYGEMYEKQIEATNINNYIINTNVESIKHSEGRRYFIADLSSDRMQDHAYFENLYQKCFTDEIGEAYYNFLLARDVSQFNPQQMPMTENKKDMINNNLDLEFKFLKFEFILPKKNLKCKPTELFSLYKEYFTKNCFGRKLIGEYKFYQKLKEINVCSRKSNGHLYYQLDYKNLEALFKSKGWIHETDYEKVNIDNLAFNNVSHLKLKTKYQSLKNKYQELQKQLLKLQEENEKITGLFGLKQVPETIIVNDQFDEIKNDPPSKEEPEHYVFIDEDDNDEQPIQEEPEHYVFIDEDEDEDNNKQLIEDEIEFYAFIYPSDDENENDNNKKVIKKTSSKPKFKSVAKKTVIKKTLPKKLVSKKSPYENNKEIEFNEFDINILYKK